MVGLAFAVAASANFPALLLALTWRRFNTTGAVTGVLVGVISSVALVIISPTVWPGPDSEGGLLSWYDLANPGIISIPLGFIGCWLGTMLSQRAARRSASFDELYVRSETGPRGRGRHRPDADRHAGGRLSPRRRASRSAPDASEIRSGDSGGARSRRRAPPRLPVRSATWTRRCSCSSTSPASRRRRSRTSCARAASTWCGSSWTRASALPDWREFAGTIVMGGPMGAYEEEAHPWLVEEKRAIRAAAQADHPVWGVCLGAQLLASALGAAVYPGPEAEVGLLPVELTAAAADDPVFGDAPARFPTLQWHGDTFDLPEGATLLASSPAYRNQAFVFERAYGLQFHLEVSPELADGVGRGAGLLGEPRGDQRVRARSTGSSTR